MITILPSKARRSLPRRAVVGTVTAAAVLTAGGIGYAAWTVTATGSSQAKAGTVSAGVITVATASADLYPGGTGAVYFDVTNPNGFPVTYNALSFVSPTITITGGGAGCLTSMLTLNAVTLTTTTDINIAANTTATAQSVAGAVTMSTGAHNDCQGATFTISGTTLNGVSG